MFVALTVSAEVWAEEGEATITFSNAGLSNQQSVNGTSFALGDYFTVTYAKNGSSTNPTYYTSGTAIRCYVTKSTSNGNTITINQTENGKGVNAYITSVTYSGKNNQGTTSFVYSGTPTNSSNYSVAYSDASKVTSVVATLKETGGSKNGQFYSTGITITYTYTAGGGAPVDPYTITLDAGSGTCAESVTEPNAGDGVTLPTPTLSSACQSEGWIFAGWATSSVANETTAAPTTLLDEGSNYKPTGNCTLYAVYSRTEEGSGGGHSEESVDFSQQGYTNEQTMSSYTGNDFEIAFNKGTNSNVPKYYSNGTAIRIYGGGYFTISSESTITKIVITFGSSDGSNAIKTNVDTYSNGTWTGSANSVKFTIGGSSGNRRIASLTVTTSGGGSTTYYHSTPECTTQTAR